MLADGLRIAVRPRSLLECFDLAVMFCGRRPLAVALATAIGAAPCILLNRAVLARPGDDAAYKALLLLGVEVAWASIPLTLYLGQSVFADRFSWRTAAASLLGGLPALIVFQGCLRFGCLATSFLAPVVFVSMYYCNQVILLERPRLTRVWRRRGTINKDLTRTILAQSLVDGLVMVAGTVLGTGFLAALSGLWNGRGIHWMSAAWNGDLVGSLFSWHAQVAFWATCGFLTVVRFFTYLDTRIRREGWDVELRLRSDETYAGLRRGHARVASGVVILMLTVLFSGRATAAGAAEGAARQALNRQSFPWYDSAADRYRPLIRPDRAASATRQAGRTGKAGRGSGRGAETTAAGPRRGAGSGRGGGRGDGGGAGNEDGGGTTVEFDPPEPPDVSPPAEVVNVVGWAVMILLLVAAAAALVLVIVRYGLGDRGSDAPASPTTQEPPDEAAAVPLPAGIDFAGGDLLARAAAWAERGDFAAAMPFLHAWMLVELDRRGRLVLSQGKTNGQYRAEVTAAAPGVAGVFAASCRLFEDAFFGHLAVDRDAFLAVWEQRGLITADELPMEIAP
jgi:hypothetical protein